jgi:hypothetical protein
MTRAGCLIMSMIYIIALVGLLALANCATQWECRYEYDETSETFLTCTAEGDTRPIPPPPDMVLQPAPLEED